jgi:hypothetical protein
MSGEYLKKNDAIRCFIPFENSKFGATFLRNIIISAISRLFLIL